MEIVFTEEAKQDLQWWKQANNSAVLSRIRSLLENMTETPFAGIGKPEALKHHLSGVWSRRITKGDRLTYTVKDGIIYIRTLRGHYE